MIYSGYEGGGGVYTGTGEGYAYGPDDAGTWYGNGPPVPSNLVPLLGGGFPGAPTGVGDPFNQIPPPPQGDPYFPGIVPLYGSPGGSPLAPPPYVDPATMNQGFNPYGPAPRPTQNLMDLASPRVSTPAFFSPQMSGIDPNPFGGPSAQPYSLGPAPVPNKPGTTPPDGFANRQRPDTQESPLPPPPPFINRENANPGLEGGATNSGPVVNHNGQQIPLAQYYQEMGNRVNPSFWTQMDSMYGDGYRTGSSGQVGTNPVGPDPFRQRSVNRPPQFGAAPTNPGMQSPFTNRENANPGGEEFQNSPAAGSFQQPANQGRRNTLPTRGRQLPVRRTLWNMNSGSQELPLMLGIMSAAGIDPQSAMGEFRSFLPKGGRVSATVF